MKVRTYLCLLSCLMGVHTLQAREKKTEDDFFDHKKQDLYGPQITLFITPDHIKYNLGGYSPIDMSIDMLHRFTLVQLYAHKLQDLGNNGTAAKPICYTIPKRIGVTAGFHAYDYYFKDPRQYRYYHTKSPYSTCYLVLANLGSFVFNTCFSQNITPNWNVGASFQSIMSDKEYTPGSVRDDKNVISSPFFDLFTHFKTDQERYQVLTSFARMKHRVRETGGIQGSVFLDRERQEALLKGDIGNNLDTVESSELRHQYHLYQQFVWIQPLHLYHELTVSKKANGFKVVNPRGSEKILGKPLMPQAASQDTIQDKTVLQRLGNELGLKGDLKRLFYCCYYRRENIRLNNQETKNTKYRKAKENYLGLKTRYTLKNKGNVFNLNTEYLFRGPYQGFYKTHIGYQDARVELAYQVMRYKPSFLVQHYHSHYRSWQGHHFTPPKAMQVRGRMHVNWPILLLKPQVAFTRVHKHLYFVPEHSPGYDPSKAIPQQAAAHADVLSISTMCNLTLWSYFHLEPDVTFTQVYGPAAYVFRVPVWLLNTRLYYANTPFNKKLAIESGVDMHWKSSYYADAYDPATQQFYLQDKFLVYGYPIVDLFVNCKIKNFRAFFKLSHVNEGLLRPGYFVTPFYPGQKRACDIGINWSFFD